MSPVSAPTGPDISTSRVNRSSGAPVHRSIPLLTPTSGSTSDQNQVCMITESQLNMLCPNGQGTIRVRDLATLLPVRPCYKTNAQQPQPDEKSPERSEVPTACGQDEIQPLPQDEIQPLRHSFFSSQPELHEYWLPRTTPTSPPAGNKRPLAFRQPLSDPALVQNHQAQHRTPPGNCSLASRQPMSDRLLLRNHRPRDIKLLTCARVLLHRLPAKPPAVLGIAEKDSGPASPPPRSKKLHAARAGKMQRRRWCASLDNVRVGKGRPALPSVPLQLLKWHAMNAAHGPVDKSRRQKPPGPQKRTPRPAGLQQQQSRVSDLATNPSDSRDTAPPPPCPVAKAKRRCWVSTVAAPVCSRGSTSQKLPRANTTSASLSAAVVQHRRPGAWPRTAAAAPRFPLWSDVVEVPPVERRVTAAAPRPPPTPSPQQQQPLVERRVTAAAPRPPPTPSPQQEAPPAVPPQQQQPLATDLATNPSNDIFPSVNATPPCPAQKAKKAGRKPKRTALALRRGSAPQKRSRGNAAGTPRLSLSGLSLEEWLRQ